MLIIYGSPLSSPTNKVRYVANYLKIPYEFKLVNLRKGEQRSPEYLEINPYGKIPAIDDNGFHLAESNAIIRYFANKTQSSIYPNDLQKRAKVDQWMDFCGQHIMFALGRIMFNTYFYKVSNVSQDERSLQEGRKFINQYLPILDKQLSQSTFISDQTITLADFILLAALDVTELSGIDLSSYSHIAIWQNKLTNESFYKDCHESYTDAFNMILGKAGFKTT